MEITVRHSEPEDYRALHCIFSGPRAVAGTLQMPFPSAEMWRERLSELPEGLYSLVACVEGKVVGSLGLETSPTCWRMRHVGSIGMAVRHDWQGKGVGTALMEAALDLADNWPNLTRIELSVYVDNAPAVREVRVRSRGHTPSICLQGWQVRGRLLHGPAQGLDQAGV
jgi:L-phenylalanine/L-methionine N-acetyltransferase